MDIRKYKLSDSLLKLFYQNINNNLKSYKKYFMTIFYKSSSIRNNV